MIFPGIIRHTYQAFLNVVFPHLCLACEEELDRQDRFVCPRCWQNILRVSPGDATIRVLMQRFDDEGIISRLFSPFYFEEQGTFQKIIHGLKYEGFTALGIELGKKVGEIISAESLPFRYECVVPIPLHRSKHRERGYNQSEYIARGIAGILGISRVDTSAVKRVRATPSQTHLNVDERKANMEDAFRVMKPGNLKGKHVLIVDDVITTGATIGECARVVQEAGAASIAVASIALARLTTEHTHAVTP